MLQSNVQNVKSSIWNERRSHILQRQIKQDEKNWHMPSKLYFISIWMLLWIEQKLLKIDKVNLCTQT